MRYGSVCSGIEAATLAWQPLGWRPAWFSEIEPFPSAVLAHHWPNVENLGDMRTIAQRVITGDVEAPDVLVGGTPCQAFSVAGLRNGLGDKRGELAISFVELADAIDRKRKGAGKHESIIIWENVPGVLSIKDNSFGHFLAGLAGEDDPLQPPGERWAHVGYVRGPSRAIAWRVLDAQYFNVAQQRKRVYVVASARADFDPEKVLFEFDGVRRDLAPGRETREKIAATTEAGVRKYSTERKLIAFGGGNITGKIDVATTCKAHGNRLDFDSETFIVNRLSEIRRLMPIECERLQGMPDNYTRIPWRNKPAGECPDGHRYRAIGNSMAVPVMRWLGQRLTDGVNRSY